MDPTKQKAEAVLSLEQQFEERTRAIERRQRVAEGMRDMLKVLNSSRPLDEVLWHLVAQACYLLGTDTGALLRLDSDCQTLRFQASLGLPDAYVKQMVIPVGQGAVGRAVVRREPVLLTDVDQLDDARLNLDDAESRALAAHILKHYRAMLAVPLLMKNEVYGGIVLYYADARCFADQDVALAVAFADQAALAIENARLMEAEQRRAEQFRLISEVGRRITTILTLDDLLSQTVRLIRDRFGYYHVHIGLVEGEDIVFKPEAGVLRDEVRCDGCARIRFRIGRDGACGHAAATEEPLVIPDVRRDPRYIPLENDPSGSALVLPLKVKSGILGILAVESASINGFDETDLAVLQSLSNQIAGAIENARLYESARQLAVLEERQRLARELHDSVSQALYGIALGARTARIYLDRDPARAVEPVEYVMSLAEASLAEMRALIFELRPESLEMEGVVAALEKQAAALRARHDLQIEVALCNEPDLPLQVKQALYRIAQEALHNAVKHSQASRLELRLVRNDETVILEIGDNGVGFETTRSFPGHLGLHSMQERADEIGAALEMTSTPGKGTRVRVAVHSRR